MVSLHFINIYIHRLLVHFLPCKPCTYYNILTFYTSWFLTPRSRAIARAIEAVDTWYSIMLCFCASCSLALSSAASALNLSISSGLSAEYTIISTLLCSTLRSPVETIASCHTVSPGTLNRNYPVSTLQVIDSWLAIIAISPSKPSNIRISQGPS